MFCHLDRPINTKTKALADAGCPLLSLSSQTMSLEDVFLQLTENTDMAGTEGSGGDIALYYAYELGVQRYVAVHAQLVHQYGVGVHVASSHNL